VARVDVLVGAREGGGKLAREAKCKHVELQVHHLSFHQPHQPLFEKSQLPNIPYSLLPLVRNGDNHNPVGCQH
jgi:hypothetical protein